MPTPNLFTTAKVIETAKKGSAKAKTFLPVDGLEVYAAIDHSIKWLTTLLETAKAPITEFANAKWIEEGIKHKKKPGNFDGSEGDATGNIQLKRRASNSGLTDIEKALCEENDIPLGTSGGNLMFNPEYTEWVIKNSAKLSAAFAKIEGCPADLIVTTPVKDVATDESIDVAFKTLGKNALAEILPVLTTLAVKPQFDDANDKALSIIKSFAGHD